MRQLAGTHNLSPRTRRVVKEGGTLLVAAEPFNLRRKSHWTGAAVGGGGGGASCAWDAHASRRSEGNASDFMEAAPEVLRSAAAGAFGGFPARHATTRPVAPPPPAARRRTLARPGGGVAADGARRHRHGGRARRRRQRRVAVARRRRARLAAGALSRRRRRGGARIIPTPPAAPSPAARPRLSLNVVAPAPVEVAG